jgi:hypothetical protein
MKICGDGSTHCGSSIVGRFLAVTIATVFAIMFTIGHAGALIQKALSLSRFSTRSRSCA